MKQKKDSNSTKKDSMYLWSEKAAALGVLLMLGAFPLFFKNNYIDMSYAKLGFFRICALELIVAAILFACIGKVRQLREARKPTDAKPQKGAQEENSRPAGKAEAFKRWLSQVPATSWFAVIFIAGILVATVFSADPLESLQGSQARMLGAFVWLLCIAVYFIIGRYLNVGKWTAWVFLAATGLVSLFAILNFMQIDPLGMYENLATEQYGMFISTIGNINACSSYLCMAVPAGIVLYVAAKDTYLRAASGVFLVLGFMAGYCTHSESWLLGLAAMFLVLLWFSMKDHGRMQKFLEVCGIFWIANILMKLLMLAGENTVKKPPMFLSFRSERILNGIMLNWFVLAAEGVLIAAAFYFIRNRKKAKKDLPYRTMRRAVFGVLGATAVLGILAAAAANLHQETWTGAFSVLEHLRLEDSSGSGRWFIWRITVQAWLDMPLWHKITGYGVNYYHMFMLEYAWTEVIEHYPDSLLMDAHNEPLQILSTMGVLGVTGYFGLLISTAVKAAKNVATRPASLLGVIVVCSYMAQGLVNNPTVFLTPYLFVMLGIMKSMERVE